jgi:hypothetical protein
MGAIHEYGYSIEVLPLVKEVRVGVGIRADRVRVVSEEEWARLR